MKNISDLSNSDLLTMICGQTGKILAKKSLQEIFGLKASAQSEMRLNEEMTEYLVHPQLAAAKELYLRAMNESIVEKVCMTDPTMIKQYLRGRLAHLENEVFVCLYFDAKMSLIKEETMGIGTVTQCSVYPREIVKMSLLLNASNVIFCHNHPSGDTNPSRADERLTVCLKDALGLIDVRVLDHIIVSGISATSMAERGLL